MGFANVKSGPQIAYENARKELHAAGQDLDAVLKAHSSGVSDHGRLWQARDRYKGAMETVKETNAALQLGRRGGQFHLSKTGGKVYQRKG